MEENDNMAKTVITMQKLLAFDVMKDTEKQLRTETDEQAKTHLKQKLCFCRRVVMGEVDVPLEVLEEVLLQ